MLIFLTATVVSTTAATATTTAGKLLSSLKLTTMTTTRTTVGNSTVSFTDLDQEREILSRISLPKSMKHSVENF
jgi:hypothetical protein